MNTELKRQTEETNTHKFNERRVHNAFPIWISDYLLDWVSIDFGLSAVRFLNNGTEKQKNACAVEEWCAKRYKKYRISQFFSILIHRSFIRNETYNWVDRKSYYFLRQNRIIKIL